MTSLRSWRGRAFIAMSLDGYIARTNGGLDWLQADSARDHQGDVTHYPAEVWGTFFPSIDTILMGRKTYETVARFDEWPFADKNVIVLSARPLLMMSESFM